MSTFIEFKEAVQDRIKIMASNHLYQVDITGDQLWETYLGSFPEGTNPMYRERTEHDCSCCRQFIRAVGGIVSIQNNQLMSVWDISIDGTYQVVADALSEIVKSRPITTSFKAQQAKNGTDFNHENAEDGVKRWEHFYCELPRSHVSTNYGPTQSRITANKEVLKRGLEELSQSAIEEVVELIKSNSIYRGQEKLAVINKFLRTFKKYHKLPDEHKDNFCWDLAVKDSALSRFRNDVIGTLVVDLSEGVDLETAVRSYEQKVAPENYQRTTSLITPSMVDKAYKKVVKLGMEDSLHRRGALLSDITIDNLIYADRSTKQALNVFEELADQVATPVTVKNNAALQEVSLDEFVEDILPTVTSMEVLFENSHINSLVTLVAPVDTESPSIFNWNNNFSWTYNGEVTDSISRNVKKAGGSINGDLRFSIQWNDNNDCLDDLDAHCIEPDKYHIYYRNARQLSPSKGILDVDIIEPKGVAVENIIYSSKNKMKPGTYDFFVRCYNKRGGKTGFSAEIEADGVIHEYFYPHSLSTKKDVPVATVTYNNNGSFRIQDKLPSQSSVKTVWGISTGAFHKVTAIMKSPNHWDDNNVGNYHTFFMLEGCNQDTPVRGFYNEFLSNDLKEHRKVFEMLGAKMVAEPKEDQLCGVGFSSTSKKQITCIINGDKGRFIKINI